MARGGSQSGLCVGQSRGPVCLASLMSTAARLNIVLTFSHINVAEELSFSNGLCMHACITHADSYSQKHTHSVPTSHNCSQSTWIHTKTNQKVAYCIVYPHISHSHTQTHPQTTHCTQRGTPQISSALSQHTLNSAVVKRFWPGLPQMYSHRIKDGYKRLQQLQSSCLHSTTFMPLSMLIYCNDQFTVR